MGPCGCGAERAGRRGREGVGHAATDVGYAGQETDKYFPRVGFWWCWYRRGADGAGARNKDTAARADGGVLTTCIAAIEAADIVA